MSGKISKAREKSYKIVTKTRKKDYTLKRENDDGIKVDVKVGEGFEILEELTVCEQVYINFVNGDQTNG